MKKTIALFSFFLTLSIITQSSALDIEQLQQQLKSSKGSDISDASSLKKSSFDEEVSADNSIDPTQYIIGAGDAFSISVIGLPSLNYSAEVNQRCDIYFPDFGIMVLGKVTLEKAIEEISQYVKKRLRGNHEVYVALSEVKMVTVNITGAIANPGTYRLRGTYRILDALKAANEDKMPSLNEMDYREVICRNGDSVKNVDLFKYLFADDLKANPYVYPGDQVTIRLSTRRAVITGAIRSPFAGHVPIRKQESLAEFLTLFPTDQSADSSSVLIKKAGENDYRKVDIAEASSVMLSDRDMIVVPIKSDYPEIWNVNVSGEVRCQGTYPIIKGKTKASDIIAMAGGETEFASKKRAVILRKGRVIGNPNEADPMRDLAMVRPEMYAGYSKAKLTNDHIVIPIGQKGSDVVLQHDDQIVIPRIDNFVYVSGNVRRPGAYAYQPGKGLGYYIKQAGGYGSRADKRNTFCMAQYGGASQIKDPRSLTEGDIIIVPDSQQAKFLSSVIVPIIGVAGTVLGIVSGIYQLTK